MDRFGVLVHRQRLRSDRARVCHDPGPAGDITGFSNGDPSTAETKGYALKEKKWSELSGSIDRGRRTTYEFQLPVVLENRTQIRIQSFP
jgi:hypothetical protein